MLHSAERSRTTELVNVFYDLVTDLYEWGWGQVSYCLFSGLTMRVSEMSSETTTWA